MPAQFPNINCIPTAVLLFPYRGKFVGNHASAIPETMNSPVAMKKHPRYGTATPVPAISITCPTIDASAPMMPKTARCCNASDTNAVRKYMIALQAKHGIVRAWTLSVDQAGLRALMIVGRKRV